MTLVPRTAPLVVADSPPDVDAPGRLSRSTALWLHATLSTTFLAASSAPSPLYGLYREAWRFSALTLTLVFASYAFALLLALLVFGRLSDHRGRRAVTLGALGLEIVSLLLFWRADAVSWLFAARLLQGFATGIATSAISAALLDLDRERGALANSVTPMIGMAIGALFSSAMVDAVAAPAQGIFEILTGLLLLQGVAAVWLPETVTRKPGAWRSLVPSAAVPVAARPTLWRLLPLNTAGWALGGFYLSLGPTLARLVTGRPAALIGGALIATLVVSGTAAVLLVRQRALRPTLLGAAATLAGGLAVTLVGVQLRSAPLLYAGTLVAGLGFGAGFNGTVRSIVPLAEPHERGALMSAYFVCSYLAFSLPAIGAGLATGLFGLMPTAMVFGATLIAMSTWVFATTLRPPR